MFLIIDNATGAEIQVAGHSHSLTHAQAGAIIEALGKSWSADRHETFEGSLGLLLTPLLAVDEDTAFWVDADEQGLQLSVMRDDKLSPIGTYDTVEALAEAVRLAA